MKKIVILILLSSFLLIFFNTASASKKIDYTLNGGEILNIQVFDNPDISSPVEIKCNPYVVRPDGYFSMPLIGNVYVKGKTTFDVTNEIIERLKEYIINPIVTVGIVVPGSTRVYILGETKRQGVYELRKSHYLVDALSEAKGFTEYSSKKNVFIIRNGNDYSSLKINLTTTKSSLYDVVLNDGDCIYLTSNNKIDFAKDIYPFFRGAYFISESRDNISNSKDNHKKENISSSEDQNNTGNNSSEDSI